MKKIGLISVVGVFLMGLSINFVKASSPEEWTKHRQEVAASCIRASGLRNAKATGKIIMFGDDVGYDALLIKGNDPKAQKMLCLFNRSTRKANVSPADEIINQE